MTKHLFVTALLSMATLSSAQAGTKPRISDALKNSNATYQILITVEPQNAKLPDTLLCQEGLLRDAVTEDSRGQYSYQGVIEANYAGFLTGVMSIEAEEGGTFGLTTQAFYFKPGKFPIGYGVGYTALYNLSLTETVFTTGTTLENGKAFREGINGADDKKKLYQVEMNLNPKLDCAARSKRN